MVIPLAALLLQFSRNFDFDRFWQSQVHVFKGNKTFLLISVNHRHRSEAS